MNWNLQVSTEHISEYILTSSAGHQVSFKYSQLQRSIRMKHNEYHGVYLLDRHNFPGRKFALRNVYGSEVGIVTKTFLKENAGTITLNDKCIFKFKIHPTTSSIELVTKSGSSYCFLPCKYDKQQEEIYLLAIVVLSWANTVSFSQAVAIQA